MQINDPTSFGTGIASTGFPTVQSTVNYGGTLAAGPAYTSCKRHSSTTSLRGPTGTIAITANSPENYNFNIGGGFAFNAPLVSFGAVGGTVATPIVYSGSITPNGGTYRLGGGGGVLKVATALIATATRWSSAAAVPAALSSWPTR